MDNDMKVLKCRYLLAMAVCFTFGLLFGLFLHLPTVSFLDDKGQNSVTVIGESGARWHERARLNGRPVGTQERATLTAGVSVTVTTKNSAISDNTPVTPAFNSLHLIVNGIYWSKSLEQRVPAGFTDNDLENWRRFASGNKIVNIQEGCGRMQNRLVTFKDGTLSCARYRINTDQIQGDVYSFYLSRLLGINNIPPLLMVTANQRQEQWKSVSNLVTDANWIDDKPVVLTKFIGNLVPAYIPNALRPDSRRIVPDKSLLTKSYRELVELVQWSDMIILDYLTGNLDRILNNMFNKQWNSEIMNGPVHNLEKSNDFLVFLDNESGLFHGYRLLDKYQYYHEQLLKSLCIFRQETINKLRKYRQNDQLGDDLHLSVRTYETHHGLLPTIPEKNLKILRQRIKHVLDQVTNCEQHR